MCCTTPDQGRDDRGTGQGGAAGRCSPMCGSGSGRSTTCRSNQSVRGSLHLTLGRGEVDPWRANSTKAHPALIFRAANRLERSPFFRASTTAGRLGGRSSSVMRFRRSSVSGWLDRMDRLLVDFFSGHAIQQLARRLRRPAKPVHHVDRKRIGIVFRLARIGRRHQRARTKIRAPEPVTSPNNNPIRNDVPPL